MKSIIFLGAKPIGFNCLNYLVRHQKQLQIKIIGVLTPTNQAANPLISLCHSNNIPLLNNLEQIPVCDFIISVQYHQILKAQHIAKAQQLAINLHLAPLPEYRGCNQFSFAIIDNAITFGATLHRLETGIDAGDIIFETRFKIPKNCWVQDLYNLTIKKAEQLFYSNIFNILTKQYTLTPQHTLIAQRGTSYHYRHEINELKNINLSWTAKVIKKHIRATLMPNFEPPYCIINEKKCYFTFLP